MSDTMTATERQSDRHGDGTRYSVREPGMCAWGETNSIREARRLQRQARDRGLHRAVIVDNVTGQEVAR